MLASTRWGFSLATALVLCTLVSAPCGAQSAHSGSPPLPLLGAPANDLCGSAESIPAAGPFPYLTSVVNVTEATTAGDPATPSCQAYISRSVWYTFQPSVTARYTISSCATAPTATTLDDDVIAIYRSTGGCSGTLTQVAAGCDDDGCGSGSFQAVISRAFSSDTLYYIVLWKYGTGTPPAAKSSAQLRITQHLPPANDVCAGAIPLGLNLPVAGTTVEAANDYQLSGQACYTGIGQNQLPGTGRDVVYTFTAPVAGLYSFRASRFSSLADLIVYVASACPGGAAPATVTACLGASNRSGSNNAEEVACLSLSANQQVYVFVDEQGMTWGNSFQIEVSACTKESEPNGTPTTATVPTQGMQGAITPNGETDLYGLGTPAQGSRVYAMVDGVPSNDTDFDLRLVAIDGSASPTVLEYDDADNDSPFGALAPNIAGAPANGNALYLEVTQYSSGAVAEPYRIYTMLQGPSATAESEPNNTIAQATHAATNYFAGTLSGSAPSTDADVYGFIANAGDLLYIGLDGDPQRDSTPVNAALELLDNNGMVLQAVNDGRNTSSLATTSGNWTAATPHSPGEGLVARVPAGGLYYVRVSAGSQVATPSTAGDYVVAISKNGQSGGGGLPADLAITKAGPDSTAAGFPMTYTMTVSNGGPVSATNTVLADNIPTGTTFRGIVLSQGSATTPAVGGTGLVSCQLGSIAPGSSATVELMVNVTAGLGTTITNTATIAGEQPDLVPGNNMATKTTVVALQAADLAIAGTAKPDSAIPEGVVSYSFEVSNNGPNAASNVSVLDSVPAYAVFTSLAVPAGWTATTPAVGSRGAISCLRASVASGYRGTFTAVFTLVKNIPDLTQVLHCPRVTALLLDPVPGNNAICQQTAVISRTPHIDPEASLLPFGFGCYAAKLPSVYAKSIIISNFNTAYNVGEMRWSATTTAPELTLLTSSGGEGSELRIRVSTAGLPMGTHHRYVTITAWNANTMEAADNSPFTLDVRIDIEAYPSVPMTQTKAVGTGAWTVFTTALGQPCAAVRSTGAPISQFTVTLAPCELPDGLFRLRYVNRWFTLSTPAANPSVDVKLYYNASELDMMAINNTAELRAWRQYPVAGTWWPVASSSDRVNNCVTMMNVTELAGVWALATPYFTTPLPLRRGEARTSGAASALLRWETDAPAPVAGMIVERKHEGARDWSSIGSVPWSESGDYIYADAAEPALGDAYRILALQSDGSGMISDPFVLLSATTEAAGPVQATGIVLEQNAPNPVLLSRTGPVRIAFTLSRESSVSLRVYDLYGRLVRVLLDGSRGAGEHALLFDAAALSPGTYMYELRALGEASTRMMVVLR